MTPRIGPNEAGIKVTFDQQRIVDFGTQRLVAVDGEAIWIPARALTIRQPWAYLSLIADRHGRKDVENRRTGFVSINFRGPIWVHASKSLHRSDYVAAQVEWITRGGDPARLPLWEDFEAGKMPGCERGGIVGRLTITDRLPPTDTPKARWHFANHHGFTTSGARPVQFVPCRGNLGFWRLPDDVAQTLARGLL